MQPAIRFAAVLLALLLVLAAAGAVLAQDVTPTPETLEEQPEAPAAPASSGMLTGLRHLHSFVRWVAVIVAVAAIVRLAAGLVQNSAYDTLARRLMVAFAGVTTLQWVIGLVFLVVLISVIGLNNLQLYNWLHLVVMTVAVGLSHMHNRFKAAPDRNRYRGSLVIVVLVLVLVFVGVAILPYGWRVFPPTGA